MKTFILAVLTIITNSVFGQTFQKVTIDSTTNKISFTEVIKLDSTSKTELYSLGREWFALNFKSADAVLEMDDKESGKLIGKAWQDIFIPSIVGDVKVKCFYTISIYVKENRFKYSISNISYKDYPQQYNPNPAEIPSEQMITDEELNGSRAKLKMKYKIETLRVVNELSESIKNGMKKKNNKKEEW